MQTQKIISLLNDSTIKSENLLQKTGMTKTVKQQKVNTNKAILSNLKQKLLNAFFFIILMHLF